MMHWVEHAHSIANQCTELFNIIPQRWELFSTFSLHRFLMRCKPFPCIRKRSKDQRVLYNRTLTDSEYVKERDLVTKNRLPSGKKGSKSKKMRDNRRVPTHVLPTKFGWSPDRPHLVLDITHERKDPELCIGGCPLGREYECYNEDGTYLCTLDLDTARHIPDTQHKPGRWIQSK